MPTSFSNILTFIFSEGNYTYSLKIAFCSTPDTHEIVTVIKMAVPKCT